MKAIVYARVSTDAQERDGTSLETQERACLEYARAAGWPVVDRIRDTASGYTLDRPGAERLRLMLRQGQVDIVIAYAVDRLSRNQNHIGVLFDEVQTAGARLEFVTEKFEDTAIGRFILAARSFIAEVEREKIAERTTRGKTERARSGRIPQGTGKGCYGYIYNTHSGHREIEPFQAAVVQRIFQCYLETRSFSAVSHELNREGVPSFMGGRWYPLTIRTILTNESYAGRLIYRRQKRVTVRSANGKRRKQLVDQPIDQRIEIEGASPRIVDEALWKRVQEIIADPERIRHQDSPAFYLLRGRMKCGLCGGAMVGQTLKAKGRPYKYYRCRHIYDPNVSWKCTAKYIPAEKLEQGMWREVSRVLSQPAVVLQEFEVQNAAPHENSGEIDQLVREIAGLVEREKRLVRLFSLGEVDEDMVREEIAGLRRQRGVLEERLKGMQRTTPTVGFTLGNGFDPILLERACNLVAGWLEGADDADRRTALEALQVAIVATREGATVTGVLPVEPHKFITADGSCQCSFNGDKLDVRVGIPFRVTVPLA